MNGVGFQDQFWKFTSSNLFTILNTSLKKRLNCQTAYNKFNGRITGKIVVISDLRLRCDLHTNWTIATFIRNGSYVFAFFN